MVDLNPSRANYYTQKNNPVAPYDSCQCTAALQCLDITDKDAVARILSYGPYDQPESNLYVFCETPDLLNYCIQSHGRNWRESVGHPAEWADVLVKAINTMCEYNAAVFKAALTVKSIIDRLDKGLPVACSMKYNGVAGHYVSIVGYNEAEFIVDDPYKDHLHGLPDGYHCMYPFDQFTVHSKGYGIYFNKRSV